MYSNINSFFLVLLILVTILTTSVFGGKGKEIKVKVDDYHTCIPLMFRPTHTTAVPSQQILMISGETLTATRHHIIPFNTLRTFINLVLSEDPFESGLGAYLAINVREIYRYFEENANAGAFPPMGPLRRDPNVLFLHGDIPMTFGGRSESFDIDHRMLAAYTWMPANLFYGPPPDRRAHDPGHNLEENAERIIGIEAFEVLRRIYLNMQNYINNPRQRTATNYDIIIADLITIASARNRPYEFCPQHWVEAGFTSGGKILYNIAKSSVVIEEVTKSVYEHDELKK